MDLVDRVSARAARRGRGDESRYSIDTWISDYLIPSAGTFTYGNTSYPFGSGLPGSLAGNRAAEIANSLPGYRAALQACPPAFAAQMVRALVLSQARFTFRNPPWHRATPRRTFGNPDLALLERPWPNGTTGNLVSRAEWHAGLAGNAFVRREPSRLRLLRPDWTAIIHGSQSEPEWPSGALDAELIGYVYANRGIGAGEPHFLLPKDMAHWAPLPDPEMTDLGMSWLTPAIREMQGDRLASEHKIRFFEQGATPNLVVKGIPAVSREQFLELVEDMEDRHAGVANAYRTLYLTAGADATVIGSNLAELDLKAVQGTGETRLSVLSRVPAALLGISEGLAGSSLNAGNFSAARRNFADTWVYPVLQDLANSLAPVVKVPADAELWYDVADMPILREDARDAADIEQVKAVTITSYVKEGFTPESAVAAVRGQDVSLLKHGGLLSVQLQPPGSGPPPPAMPPAAGNGAQVPQGRAAPFRQGGELDRFDPAEPRDPRGRWVHSPGIGLVDKLTGAKADLTDEQYHAHTRAIEQRLSDALARGEATDARHAVDAGKGVWKPERARIHKQIVNDLYARQSKGVPSEGKAVISGGLGGAGKSTVLKGPAGVDAKRYVTLNPDDVKEEMVRRGLVPEVGGLSPMEASALIHEESSHITNLLAKRAYADRKNVIWDITMAGRGSAQRRIDELRASGYKNLSAVFVDIPVETSVTRALARHRRGLATANGGRYVPPSIIRKNASATASSANREVFDSLRGRFDHWSVYDNSGAGPKLVASSGQRAGTGHG